MSCIEQHTLTLRSRGYRMTAQRLAILQALHDGGHLSPSRVYDRVRTTGMTEATVYRTLDFLAENGVVLAADRGNGHRAYELAASSHHHVTCRRCGAQAEVEARAASRLVEQFEQQTGYQLHAGHLTFFGLCPACQEAE